jgi:hypothetical protein
VRELAERAYFVLCLALGRLLRSARYSKARIVHHDGKCQVRKSRLFYAPLLVWLGGSMVRILDTGVRVLPQRDWEERECRVYRILYGTSVRIDADGVLVLPCLPGRTLASLLEDPEVEESVRKRAIELAVAALAEFHHLGFTHGDAMAENVLVDLAPRRCSSLDCARDDPEPVEGSGRPEHSSKGVAGVARWFDFETVHDASRPMAWRRADDVRALLVTCLVRTSPEKRAETLQLILDIYTEPPSPRLPPLLKLRRTSRRSSEISGFLAMSFTTVWRRSLTFHLAQAGLSLQCFREIARLLKERLGDRS